MEFGESKKLMRGLNDLSPMFGKPSELSPYQQRMLEKEEEEAPVEIAQEAVEVAVVEELPEVKPNVPQNVCVMVPEVCDKSHELAKEITQHLSGLQDKVAHVSIGRESGKSTTDRHLTSFSWEELEERLEQDQNEFRGLEEQACFYSFHRFPPKLCRPVLETMDHMIIMIRPTFESLMEGYRFLKTGYEQNRYMKFYAVFEGAENDGRKDLVIEAFQNIVGKHLNSQISVLGWLDFTKRLSSQMEQLFLERFRHFPEGADGPLNHRKLNLLQAVSHKQASVGASL